MECTEKDINKKIKKIKSPAELQMGTVEVQDAEETICLSMSFKQMYFWVADAENISDGKMKNISGFVSGHLEI